MSQLFVDTSYLCSFYNKSDSLHERAKKILPLLKNFQVVLSSFVLLECYTVLSQRVSKQHVLSFKEDMYDEKYYHTYWVDKMLEKEVWNIFSSIKDKNFSYVDASTLAIIKREKISHLLSFDASFAQFQNNFGFTLIGV